eukprot:scaffold10285_cov105-Isochrysis_galbana.AAC.8
MAARCLPLAPRKVRAGAAIAPIRLPLHRRSTAARAARTLQREYEWARPSWARSTSPDRRPLRNVDRCARQPRSSSRVRSLQTTGVPISS